MQINQADVAMTMPAASAASNESAQSRTSPGTDALANKEVFLQMLVAQIQNQDPLNPTDGAQFMTQLAQFSSLEQLIGIRNTLENLTSGADGEGASQII
jgi:flagellar basal-body rod modification protein FlgD